MQSTQSSGEFEPKTIELALEVLQQCRARLMVSYRFLDSALWRMPFEPASLLKPIESNGIIMWFNPLLVLARYRSDENELIRDFLHCVMHCVLRHPFDETHENSRAWWLSCDMAVEAMMMEMTGVAFPCPGDKERRAALNTMRKQMETVSPQHLYNLLDKPIKRIAALEKALGRTNGEIIEDPIAELEELFVRDSHAHWPQSEEDMPDESSLQNAEQSKDITHLQKQATPHTEDKVNGSQQGTAEETELLPTQQSIPPDLDQTQTKQQRDSQDTLNQKEQREAEKQWQNISKRIQEELEVRSLRLGGSANCLLANLIVANRRPVDYSDFLRKFATMKEDMRINDEEFDYIFYTYGLDTYGNMPLIEPLEYQETNRVRDFIIAIDTSGSCSGALVKHFIDRTFQILSETQRFGSRVNIHIVQCDNQVREDIKISSLEELAEFTTNFEVKGLGGTDFRPLFEYVNELQEAGEFEDLRGVIYFTDGYGIFPSVIPAYETAFVFVEDEGCKRTVPPWAMKVILTNDQISVL